MRNYFNTIPSISRSSGFTLIEIIAVLAILGILASLSIPRFIDLDSSATKQALVSSVTELNGRESLTWSKVKLSITGWVEDEGVFAKMDTGLPPGYKWSPQAKIDGGKLLYKEQMIKLERKPSTDSSAAKWEITQMSSD
jgi:prepilin-type N-terminal cleavage/methylation domain-containing protein